MEDLPSPGKVGGVEAGETTLEPSEDKDAVAFVFKTLADPYAGRINLFRVYKGVVKHDSHMVNLRAQSKERIGQLIEPQGKEQGHVDEFGPGDIGAVAKLKETHAGDVLAASDIDVTLELPKFPLPVMAFAIEPKAKGDEEKVANAITRRGKRDRGQSMSLVAGSRVAGAGLLELGHRADVTGAELVGVPASLPSEGSSWPTCSLSCARVFITCVSWFITPCRRGTG